MVTVNYVCFVIVVFTQGLVSNAQDAPVVAPTEPPRVNVLYDYGSYGAYDYDPVKQNDDYVKQYEDYQYGDYGGGYDYGNYENVWQYEDYGYYTDYDQHYGDYYGYGDRNNPLDAVMSKNAETAIIPDNQTPWVYIIVPVVQIDVFYIDDKDKAIEDIELQLPIETFLFELGDFGMAHFDLGSLGFGGDYGLGADYGYGADYGQYDYPYYGQYPSYGHYNDYGSQASLFDTADQLADIATLDYPGLDHDNYWIDWIFMLPPNDLNPQVFR